MVSQKEKFVQEELFIEEMLPISPEDLKKKIKEDDEPVERGVIVIDLF